MDRMNPSSIFVLMIALLLATTMAGAEIYRWKGADGRWHYGDQKPGDRHAETVSVQVNTIESVSVQEWAAAGPDVIMYSAEWCGVCKRAAAFFRREGIAFTEYDVEKSSRGRADYRAMRGTGVPIILVGGARMNGFDRGRFEALYARR